MTEREIPISDGKEEGGTDANVQPDEQQEQVASNPSSTANEHDAMVAMLESRVKELEGEK